MNDLYELTRKLVERGCPEHPSLKYAHKSWFIALCKADDPWELLDVEPDGSVPDARDLWTMHALRWLEALVGGIAVYGPGTGTAYAVRWDAGSDDHGAEGATILEAIEAATRHLSVKE